MVHVENIATGQKVHVREQKKVRLERCCPSLKVQFYNETLISTSQHLNRRDCKMFNLSAKVHQYQLLRELFCKFCVLGSSVTGSMINVSNEHGSPKQQVICYPWQVSSIQPMNWFLLLQTSKIVTLRKTLSYLKIRSSFLFFQSYFNHKSRTIYSILMLQYYRNSQTFKMHRYHLYLITDYLPHLNSSDKFSIIWPHSSYPPAHIIIITTYHANSGLCSSDQVYRLIILCLGNQILRSLIC